MDKPASDLLQGASASKFALVAVIFILGWFVARFVSKSLERFARKHLDSHRALLVRRLVYYAILIVAIITGLNEAGINLSVIVGAAGVASVAIGFASQTSMSNLISGIFVIIEKPFMVGDTIRVGQTTGIVAFMGLLSTILKTPDNIMVRIPNETLMKSEIFNITRYPIRRFDLNLVLSHWTDLRKAKLVLLEIASQEENILKEPAPAIHFKDISSAGFHWTYCIWTKSEKLLELSFEIPLVVRSAFERAGIDMAIPPKPLSSGDIRGLKIEPTQA